MIALERPFISQFCPSDGPRGSRFFLEYGSASRLYTVPLIHHEEQVTPQFGHSSALIFQDLHLDVQIGGCLCLSNLVVNGGDLLRWCWSQHA